MSLPRQNIEKITIWALVRKRIHEFDKWDGSKKGDPYYEYPIKHYNRISFYSDFNMKSDNPYSFNSQELAETNLKIFKKNYKHHASKMEIRKISIYKGYEYNIPYKENEIKVHEKLSLDKKSFTNLKDFLKKNISYYNNGINDYNKEIANNNKIISMLNTHLSDIEFCQDLKELINEEN